MSIPVDSRRAFEERLQTLQREYRANLPKTVAALEDEVRALGAGSTSERWTNIMGLAHRIIGAATTFGHPGLGRAGRQIQSLAERRRLAPQNFSSQERWTLAEAMEEVRQSLTFGTLRASGVTGDYRAVSGNFPAVAGETVPDAALPKQRTIFVVEQPSDEGAYGDQLEHFGYAVRQLSSVAQVEAAFARNTPDLLIMGSPAESDCAVTMEILRVMREKRVRPAHIITVSARTDMDARLESVRAGGTAFLTKPIDLSVLLDKIDNLTFDGPKAPYRVMLVSELGTRAREVALGLGQLNMLVSLVDESSELLDPIAEFQPEVIVLETRYRSCTGMELASMLRQDDQFVGIPILFLSDEVNEVRQTAAIRVGADEFLSGDLSIKRISSAIAARADRARVLRSYMEKDGLTGLLNHSRIENQLEVEVFRAQRRNAPCSVAMIDLDGFKKINDTYGHAFGDRVLRSLSLMLRQRLRRTDFVGRWGGEEFAVVLPDTPASVAQRVLDEIRDGFSRVRHMYEGRPIFVTYSCGIAAFPDESRANRLVESADSALYRAKHAGRNRVFIAEQEHAEAPPAAAPSPAPTPVFDDADGWPDPAELRPATAAPQPLLRNRA